MANNSKQCFNTHYQSHCHPTTKSLWLCSSVYCRPPHQSRRIWLVAAATNQKGLWLLNKKCVIIDQFSHWSQQVYHSYSETCQVFVYPLIWSEPTGSQGELLIRSISYCCTQWRNSRRALCLPTVEIGIYLLFCPWKGYSVCHSGNKLSKRQLWLWNRFW